MGNQKDILLDENNDLLIKNGDFAVGESEEQEIKMILQAVKNDYKQFPELGVDLVRQINKSGSERTLKQLIKLNLRADNKEYNKITIKNGEIVIE